MYFETLWEGNIYIVDENGLRIKKGVYMSDEQVCMEGQTCEDNPACCEILLWPKFKKDGAAEKALEEAYDFSELLKELKAAGIEIGLKAGAELLLVVSEWLANGANSVDALLAKLKEKGLDYAEVTALRVIAIVINWLRGSSQLSENRIDDTLLLFVDFADLAGQVAAAIHSKIEELKQ